MARYENKTPVLPRFTRSNTIRREITRFLRKLVQTAFLMSFVSQIELKLAYRMKDGDCERLSIERYILRQ